MYADEVIRPWFGCLAGVLGDQRLFDAHTHTGANDPDGFHGTAEALLDALACAGDARAVVFTMQEPDGYPAANDRVLAEAAASEGRLVAFCRLDPHEQPLAEAERCLAAGAAGIKLHPRAERFALADPVARPILELANERALPVLVHAGRGIPALGRDSLELCEQLPDMRLILAHCGISDLSWLWRHAPDHPNLLFDTSWWGADDLLTLFSLVPPGQVLLGSDAPYGTPLSGAVTALRCALQVGLSPEQVQSVAGGQLERILAGEDLAELGPALGGAAVDHDLLLGRVHTYLVTAFAQMVRGRDGREALALARMSCDLPDDAPQRRVCESVLELLDRIGPDGQPDEALIPFTPGTGLVATAMIVARTPDVALPDV